MKLRHFAGAGLAILFLAGTVTNFASGGQIIVSDDNSLRQALNNANPGDEILLSPGTYAGGLYVVGLTGVTMRSLDAGAPAVIDAGGGNECMHLVDPVGVTVKDLIFQNANDNGINIDDGGTYATPADGVVLRNVTVLNTNPDGNHDGIKLSGVDNFHVDRCRVVTWGGSAIDMVGCHQGLIENSYFADPSGLGSTGVRPKGGSANIIIRANRLVDASDRAISIGGSTGLLYFRPQPPGTVEADNIIAEGNVVIRSEASVAYINIDGGVTVRRNFIYRPQHWVMRILKENTNPGFVDTARGEFLDNVVVWHQGDLSTFVNIGSNTLPGTFVFARNQWYNATSPGNSTPSLPAPETDGVYGVDPGLDVDEIVPWTFEGGLWLVNANDAGKTTTVASPESVRLATPGAGAELDFDQTYPLIGQWSFSALEGPSFSMEAFSQAVLIDPTAIPDDAKVPGDANVDGMVDGADYTLWADHYNAAGDWMGGDFSGDDFVDGGDYTIWADHYGFGVTAGGQRVPEPTALAVLVVGAAAIIRRSSGLRSSRGKRISHE
ncbi:MAG TPA: right-handed parallel beta-helix repeat-containing protein [Phycisphaerae bacterium]|nr:right-handed parallel beta-helix repeat-containing protein [Phycisphaerae bacterium]